MAAVLLVEWREILSFLHFESPLASLLVEDDSLETRVPVGPQEWGCGVFDLGRGVFSPYLPVNFLYSAIRSLGGLQAFATFHASLNG